MGNPDYHICPTCDYTWKHGEHGGHDCAYYMSQKLEKMSKLVAEQNRKRGLKDDEIRDLVDLLNSKLKPLAGLPACSRDLLSRYVTKFLESRDLRIDKV